MYRHGVLLHVDVHSEGVDCAVAVDDGPVGTRATDQVLPRNEVQVVVDGEEGLVDVALDALTPCHGGPEVEDALWEGEREADLSDGRCGRKGGRRIKRRIG